MRRRKHEPLPELGDLERAVLEYLWDVEDADVIQTHKAVGRRREISVNTVGSALERLHRKALVHREKVSHAYRYKSALSRQAFLARQVVNGVGGFKALADRGVLSCFIDLVAEDGKTLDAFEDLIRQKQKERTGAAGTPR